MHAELLPPSRATWSLHSSCNPDCISACLMLSPRTHAGRQTYEATLYRLQHLHTAPPPPPLAPSPTKMHLPATSALHHEVPNSRMPRCSTSFNCAAQLLPHRIAAASGWAVSGSRFHCPRQLPPAVCAGLASRVGESSTLMEPADGTGRVDAAGRVLLEPADLEKWDLARCLTRPEGPGAHGGLRVELVPGSYAVRMCACMHGNCHDTRLHVECVVIACMRWHFGWMHA